MNYNKHFFESIERVKSKITQKGIYLGNPLTLAQIEFFEAQHGVRLPEDYRKFLLEIGNGGSGPPVYGLRTLVETVTKEIQLKQKFPLVSYWVWENEEEIDKDLHNAVYYYGSLNLGTDGCGEDWILIVNGTESGNIWHRADVGTQPCTPPRNFISWYEYWLDGGSNWFDV